MSGMGAESMRKAYLEATRKGVFGTTSSRAQPSVKKEEPEVPGPAHYQVKEKPFRSKYQQMGSNFASVTQRIKDNDKVCLSVCLYVCLYVTASS